MLLTCLPLIAMTSVVISYELCVPGSNDFHCVHGVHNGLEKAKDFFNEWTVEVYGGEDVAQLVALELGYLYGGPVSGGFSGHFVTF